MDRLRQLARAASKTRYYGAVFAGLGLAPGDLFQTIVPLEGGPTAG